jgi:hypothetical protein
MLPGACDHLRDLSAAPSPPPFSISFSPKLTRGAAILDSDAQVNGRYVRGWQEGRERRDAFPMKGGEERLLKRTGSW